jgi:hypothetical protein
VSENIMSARVAGDATDGPVLVGDADPALDELIRGFRDHRDRAARGEAQPEAELAHLHVALQAAVTLEFATLPPYLSALWSVKDDIGVVANSLRQIVQEEMLHLALAANMLVSIGGRPQVASAAPEYPGQLPLQVHPELTVHLAALAPATLATFLEIERPNHPGHHIALNAARDLDEQHRRMERTDDPADLTIGAFYEHILESFRRLTPPMSTARQVTAPLASMVVKGVDDVARAIGIITREGEGSDGPADTGAYNLAHYYRFAEIIEGKHLVQDPATGDYAFVTPIDFDMHGGVWPMAPVPEGGYVLDTIDDDEVRRLLHGSNLAYTRLLDLLQAVWESDGGQGSLWHAIDAMFELEKYAKRLMQVPRPGGDGNYGPDFRYLSDDQRGVMT